MMLDKILAIVLIAILLALLKFLGFILEKPIRKLFRIKTIEQINDNRKQEFEKIYPVDTATFPIEHLEKGDRVSFENGDTYTYFNYRMARHSLWQGQSELLVSDEELQSKAISLKCKDGIKWVRPTSL